MPHEHDKDRIQELIRLYESKGEPKYFDEAHERLTQEISENPDNADLLRQLSYLHECKASREIRKAAGLLEKAIELSPEEPAFHRQLVRLRSRALEDNRSVQYYKKWIHARPDDAVGYTMLAEVYLKMFQLEEARKVIETGLKIHPAQFDLILLEGELFAKQGMIDSALASWKRACELDPANAELHEKVGEQHAKFGRLDHALGYWEKARELDPKLIRTRFSAVFLLEHAGRLEEAIHEWKEIVSFLHANGFHHEAEWPQRELQRVENKKKGMDTPY
ncbi:tetratricopeptide repeat protein [Paenibacillus oceani]|uniref:Tetratricopeptide repeat protein n=1 Tax=Paenibacillus oceani TaxID=2772510 RepID=A0A927C4A8_9BACL|nr:tetratricopeptide repeat protein [Paenibacillus oceani]MBD2860559.1 tetratricopeptide repeat protein [Paenibacillus oceani]